MDLDPKYDDYDFPIKAPVAANGHAGYLTREQIAQVHQLRAMLEQEGLSARLDTLTLLRFLRARKFSVIDAKKMFIKSEEWRKDKGIDKELPTWTFPKEEMSQHYAQFYHKTDKSGRPVYIECLGGFSYNAVSKIASTETMLKNLAIEYERVADPRLPACSRKAGHLLETCCTIIDLAGFSFWEAKSVYNQVIQAADLSKNHYPERLGYMYIINASWGIPTLGNAVMETQDPVTKEKIKFLGKDYQEELLARIPKENLPVEYGGSCTCEGLGGCKLSDMGPWRDPEWTKPAKWEKKIDEQKGEAADKEEVVPEKADQEKDGEKDKAKRSDNEDEVQAVQNTDENSDKDKEKAESKEDESQDAGKKTEEYTDKKKGDDVTASSDAQPATVNITEEDAGQSRKQSMLPIREHQ